MTSHERNVKIQRVSQDTNLALLGPVVLVVALLQCSIGCFDCAVSTRQRVDVVQCGKVGISGVDIQASEIGQINLSSSMESKKDKTYFVVDRSDVCWGANLAFGVAVTGSVRSKSVGSAWLRVRYASESNLAQLAHRLPCLRNAQWAMRALVLCLAMAQSLESWTVAAGRRDQVQLVAPPSAPSQETVLGRPHRQACLEEAGRCTPVHRLAAQSWD
jgi:hypothetical protein